MFPALTTTGLCEIMVFEGIPSGPICADHPPSGRKFLGLGDTVCRNDPITGKGSNNAGVMLKLADRMANGIDDPRDFFPWFADPDAASTYPSHLRSAA